MVDNWKNRVVNQIKMDPRELLAHPLNSIRNMQQFALSVFRAPVSIQQW